jgi:hypothetical protein
MCCYNRYHGNDLRDIGRAQIIFTATLYFPVILDEQLNGIYRIEVSDESRCL